MNGTIIMAIKNGQSVSVLQKSSPWSRVKVGNREGYVATKYLNFGSSSGSVSGTAAVVHNPKSTQVLNLRREPNLDAQVLAYYHNGTKVTILGNVDSKWRCWSTARIGARLRLMARPGIFRLGS